MKFDENELIKLMDGVCKGEQIQINDIPCVDLYMDQVTSFFEDKLSYLKRDKDEKILTKTMINNYAKGKILLPVKNKKYTKENIMLLTLIYNLKQILPINDIGKLFEPIFKGVEEEEEGKKYLQSIYTNFLDMQNDRGEEIKRNFEEKLTQITSNSFGFKDEKEESEKLILSVLLLISGANLQKRMAEKILDNFFKDEEKQIKK
ncbi:DUF1836 domain-containing protein [Haloimpatiens sp. FM7315]|uniref:DUF1836 domain-containing protein n=1 Tax=Haloimpatiens sp. FM7315 TaxID=3298609 RepID=UPI0035A2B22C